MTVQLVIGLFIASLGIVFTLDNLGIVEARDYLRFWPIVFVAIGVAQIAQAQTPARVIGGGLWILIGTLILGRELRLLPPNIRDYWPLLLVMLGAYVIWQSFNLPRPREGADADGFVSAIALLGGFSRRVTSNEFRGAELTAFMGGGKLDLREARMAGEEAVINCFTLMGGFEILIPETWSVRIEVVPFMGGCDDKTKSSTGGSGPRLIVRGFVMMGGIDIKN
jgi:predicted membrane protein